MEGNELKKMNGRNRLEEGEELRGRNRRSLRRENICIRMEGVGKA